MPQPSIDPLEVAEAGFEAFDKVDDLMEAAKNVAGAAGDPRAFTVLIDIEAEGSTETQRAIELYVFGNMPAEMLDSILPLAVKRYKEEQARGSSEG